MSQEPKKRHSRARQGKRRASISFDLSKGMACPNCKKIILPHTICKGCGYYGGKSMMTVQQKAIVKRRTVEKA